MTEYYSPCGEELAGVRGYLQLPLRQNASKDTVVYKTRYPGELTLQ